MRVAVAALKHAGEKRETNEEIDVRLFHVLLPLTERAHAQTSMHTRCSPAPDASMRRLADKP